MNKNRINSRRKVVDKRNQVVRELTDFKFIRMIFPHIITLLLVIIIGIIDFSDFSNFNISWERLKDPKFLTITGVRWLLMAILRFLYIRNGTMVSKIKNPEHREIQEEIRSDVDDILITRRMNEFEIYTDEIVDKIDLLEHYENIINRRLNRLQRKNNIKHAEKIADLIEEKVLVAEYKNAILNRNVTRLKELSKEFNIDKISVRRIKITPEILIDGYENTATINQGIVFDERKEQNRKVIGGMIWSLIAAVLTTVVFNEFILDMSNWQNKLVNIVVTLVLLGFTIYMALMRGFEIAEISLMKKKQRHQKIKAFRLTNKDTYTNFSISIKPDEKVEKIEKLDENDVKS